MKQGDNKKKEISPRFLYVYNIPSFNYALLFIFIIYFFGGQSRFYTYNFARRIEIAERELRSENVLCSYCMKEKNP